MSLNFEYIAAVLDDYCDMQTSGLIATANRYPVADVQEQVALLEGAQLVVELANDHRDACLVWEKTLMQAVGEDGPADVVKAIDAIKAQRDNAWQELREIREAISANPEESTADEVRRVVAERDRDLVQVSGADRAGFIAGFELCQSNMPPPWCALVAVNYQGLADQYAERVKAGKS